jgi:hypothetical protein
VVDLAEYLVFPEIDVGCVIHSLKWNTSSDSKRYIITSNGSPYPATAWLDSDRRL